MGNVLISLDKKTEKEFRQTAKDLFGNKKGALSKTFVLAIQDFKKRAKKRKAFEETGLSVSVRKKIGFYETIFQDGPFSSIKGGVHTINVCFLAKCLDKHPKVRMDKTSKDYKWIDALDCSLPTYPQQVLKDAGDLMGIKLLDNIIIGNGEWKPC